MSAIAIQGVVEIKNDEKMKNLRIEGLVTYSLVTSEEQKMPVKVIYVLKTWNEILKSTEWAVSGWSLTVWGEEAQTRGDRE